MKTPLIAVTVSLLGVALAPDAHADRRSFTQTYEYMTMAEGETELELYTEQARALLGDPSPQAFGLQLAVEHGITDRWDVSLFHAFAQRTGPDPDDAEPLHFSELRLRSRYRLSERGELPVDMLGDAELVKVFGESRYRGEVRAVLARDFDKLTAAINLIGAIELGASVEDTTELAAGWAAGLTYEAFPELKLGVESWGGFDLDTTDEVAATVGPALAWSPSTSLWLATTAGFGLTEHTDDFSVRAIIGLHIQ